MIKKASIKNYQSHKKTELEFHPNVNAIIGASDKGKSSIFRALRWGIDNKRSANYRSNWGGDTSVELFTDEGIVKRIKTDKENMYTLNNDQEYKAIGQDVPQDIKDVLNLSDINIQPQHNKHFLLSETSGEVARYFNKIADLEIIDRSLKNVDGKIRVIKNEIAFNGAELNKEQSELKEYDWLDKAEKDFESIDELDSELIETVNESNNIESIIDEINELEEDKIEVDIVTAEKDLDEIEDLQEDIKVLTEEHMFIYNFIGELEELEEDKIGIDLDKAGKDLKIIIELQKEHKSIETDYDNIKELYDDYFDLDFDFNRVDEKILLKEKELLKIMPSVCPVCDNPIKKGK